MKKLIMILIGICICGNVIGDKPIMDLLKWTFGDSEEEKLAKQLEIRKQEAEEYLRTRSIEKQKTADADKKITDEKNLIIDKYDKITSEYFGVKIINFEILKNYHIKKIKERKKTDKWIILNFKLNMNLVLVHALTHGPEKTIRCNRYSKQVTYILKSRIALDFDIHHKLYSMYFPYGSLGMSGWSQKEVAQLLMKRLNIPSFGVTNAQSGYIKGIGWMHSHDYEATISGEKYDYNITISSSSITFTRIIKPVF